jgi:hypothetical protein
MFARLAVNTATHAKTFQANAHPAKPHSILIQIPNASALVGSSSIKLTHAWLALPTAIYAQIRPVIAPVVQPASK